MSFKISVIIPILNEEKYIKTCLNSIINSNYPKKDMEIILVDGMSTDRTRDIIKIYQNKYDFIYLLDNPKKIAPVAMNLGIKKAQGEYIIRLDAHSSYPSDYFSKLIKWHQKLDAQNIGGLVITDVKCKTKKSMSIKEVLSHRFGVGNSDFRTGIDKIKEVDTVPFGCYHKDVFKNYGLYDERLIRNQDIEFNKRIIRNGGKIYLVPDIKCTYYARENFTELMRNNYNNGKWNILTAYYTKTLNSLSFRHFIPLLFILSILSPFIISFWYPSFIFISFISLGTYLFLVTILSIRLKNDRNTILYLFLSFFLLHLSYGWGELVGIFLIIKKYIKGEK